MGGTPMPRFMPGPAQGVHRMHKVLSLGAGKIGSAVAHFLSHSGAFDVLVGDVSEECLRRLDGTPRVGTIRLDSASESDLARAMHGRQSVLSALNYSFNPDVARAALGAGLSYFDLPE